MQHDDHDQVLVLLNTRGVTVDKDEKKEDEDKKKKSVAF